MTSADQTGIFELSAKWMHRWPQRYGVACVAVVLAALIRYGLGIEIGFTPPFLVFFPGIILMALLGGFGPGIFATTLSAAVGRIFVAATLRIIGCREIQRYRSADPV